jgi:AcrR family transcriptional regulator
MADARKQVRGEELVAKVLQAALHEVARVGVEHLSIEEVAARADVNKTTIYRRWPTPEGLARAALACAAEADSSPPDTGSLRGDLHEFARAFRRIATLPDMKTVLRLRWSGTANGPLARLTRGIQEKKHAQWKLMLKRGVSRGELPAGANVDLIYDVVVGALIYLVVLSPRRSDATRVGRAIDTILDGALQATGRPARRRRLARASGPSRD